MADLSDIREGLVAALTDTLAGEAQNTGYTLARPTAPFVDIDLADPAITYDEAAARGLDIWHFVVRIGVSYNLDLQAQKQLDAYAASSGATSVKAALEADQSLGGLVQAVHVTSMSGYRKVASDVQPVSVFLAAEWTVEVYARGL